MSEHTPGPWAVTDEDDFNGLAIEAAGREGEYVPVARVPVDYDDRPEREANAALIARAPEMAAEIERLTARVDELEEALERIDRIEVYDEDAMETLRSKLGVMRDIARAAITQEPT